MTYQHKRVRNLTWNEYINLHNWVRRSKGKASICELNQSHASKKYEWAFIGEDYEYDLEKFQSLCTSCHKKMDITDKAKKAAGERARGNQWHIKPVEQLDRSGKLIAKFPTIRKAAQQTGTNRISITNNLSGRVKSAGGFIWRTQS